MTPDEARLLFFQHLPLVRNSSDLLRLTLRVLPHLSANPERPLGAIDTMVFRLQLEHAKSDDTIRVWYNSNRDVSAQLRTLEPLYTRGSSGPSFCSGLSHRMKLPNGPNVNGPGLPLGVFAKEHATAKKKLDAATSVEQWWTLFLGYTPLWLRTAYHWDKPTPEQKMVLKSAKKAMLGYAPEMIRRTRVSYDHRNGKTSTRFEPMFASYAFLKHAHTGMRWVRVRSFFTSGTPKKTPFPSRVFNPRCLGFTTQFVRFARRCAWFMIGMK